MIKRFNRYELKYFIHVSQQSNLIRDLETMVTPDPHGDDSASYRIINLYYDSPDMQGFWSKMDGLKFRRKLRLRIYPRESLQSVKEGMVEIKQRINETVQKRRIQLPLEDAEALCGGWLDLDRVPEDDLATANEIAYMVHALDVQPTAITSYRREAYVGGMYDAGLRITFDTDFRGRVNALQVNEDTVNRLMMSPDWCILEVKVNETLPQWVISLLAKHQCRRQRVSKYCAVVASANNIKSRQRNMPAPVPLFTPEK